MSHPTHNTHAYRDQGNNMWVAYCKLCSADTDDDLRCECPGEYIRKDTSKQVDNSKEQS